MALPKDIPIWEAPMDPADITPYVAVFIELLNGGELINPASFVASMSTEGAALGLSIITAPPRAPAVQAGGTEIAIWIECAPGFQQHSAFSADGTMVGIEFSFDTTASPSRFLQRTFVLKVQQR